MYTVYGMSDSGNCYKVKLLLELLHEPYRWVEVDSTRGETRTPEFLARNPNGKVPLLETTDGRRLPESNAILCYLAEGSEFLPAERWTRAEVLQWLFWEQYSHEPYVATARSILLHQKNPAEPSLPQKTERGYQALALMDRHLAQHRFFVCEKYTVADIALYAYSHVAHQGGFDLSRFPALRAWFERVAAHPRHVPLLV